MGSCGGSSSSSFCPVSVGSAMQAAVLLFLVVEVTAAVVSSLEQSAVWLLGPLFLAMWPLNHILVLLRWFWELPKLKKLLFFKLARKVSVACSLNFLTDKSVYKFQWEITMWIEYEKPSLPRPLIINSYSFVGFFPLVLTQSSCMLTLLIRLCFLWSLI